MDVCAKCGKELGFRDKRKAFHLTSFLNALKAGLFPELSGKQVCLSCQRELCDLKGIKYRGFRGITQGMTRINELKLLALQKNEEDDKVRKKERYCYNCYYFGKDDMNIDVGFFTPNYVPVEF